MSRRYAAILSLGLLLLAMGLWLGFQNEAEEGKEEISREEKIIQQAIDKKVKAHLKKRDKECQERILRRADVIVDSMIINLAKGISFGIIDSFFRPPKPNRPYRPSLDLPELDTTIAPFFNPDSLLQLIDSLDLDSAALDSMGYDSLQIDSLQKLQRDSF